MIYSSPSSGRVQPELRYRCDAQSRAQAVNSMIRGTMLKNDITN
jgi:hypothetical protein